MQKPMTFEVTSGALTLSDPYNTPDTWCIGELDNARNGTWIAEIEYLDDADWGRRVSLLRAWHQDFAAAVASKTKDDHWIYRDDLDIGVDSGQAGIFDRAFFDHTPRGDYYDKASFYGAACELTYRQLPKEGEEMFTAGVLMGRGVVSSSGVGDGYYDAYVYKDESGAIVGAMIVYLYDGDEENEEEEAA